MTRRPDAGFTLIESLVAMVVLALGAVSLLTAIEGHIARVNDVAARQAARWAAEYALTAADLRLDISQTTIFGYDFGIDTQTQPTADAGLMKISVSARNLQSDRVLFVLNGYIETVGGQ